MASVNIPQVQFLAMFANLSAAHQQSVFSQVMSFQAAAQNPTATTAPDATSTVTQQNAPAAPLASRIAFEGPYFAPKRPLNSWMAFRSEFCGKPYFYVDDIR